MICRITLLTGPAAHADGTWRWTIEPYLMASNIDGTAGIGRVTGTEVSMDTRDILDKLEIGAMIRGETLHESGRGLMVDYAFMRVGDDFSLPLGGIVDATLRQR